MSTVHGIELGWQKGFICYVFFKTVIIFSLTFESDSIACTFPCTSTLVYEIIKDWIYIMTANVLSLVKKARSPKRSLSSIYPENSTKTRRWVIRCPRSKLTLVTSRYFGTAQSKGFATLRNVTKLTFLRQDWVRKICRFSVLFGYLTKWEPN